MADLTIAVNTGSLDQEYLVSGNEWTDIDEGNDFIIPSAGSASVADGESIPSESEILQAGSVVGGGSQVIVAKFFLADFSEDELKEIYGMGNQNRRYVMAFSFDDATASEPVLEMWDDADMDSYDTASLGAGVANQSWWKGVTTTDGNPGSDWTGSSLAGSSEGNFLWLNNENGSLSGADILYCNLKIVIPATASTGSSQNPIIVCKFASN
jgi:hypothetical protein